MRLFSKLSIGLFSLLFFGFISAQAAEEQQNFATALEKVPQECRVSAYEIPQGKTASQMILQKALELQKELLPKEKSEESIVKKSNALERSYVWLRRKTNIEEFFGTFDFLRASECLRKDVRDLEDILADVTRTYQKSLEGEGLDASAQQKFSARIATLENEVSNLRTCGDIEKSVYFEERYQKSVCEPSEQKMFEEVQKSFKTLGEKLKNLFSAEGWKEILSYDAWKMQYSPGEQKKIQEGIDSEAASWLERNSLFNVSGISQLPLRFSQKDETFASDSHDQEKLKKAQENANAEAQKKAEDLQRKALTYATLSDAISAYQKGADEAKALREYGKNTIYEFFFIILDSSGAKYWREKIQSSEQTVVSQKKHVDTLTKALKELNNSQAKNVK